MAVKYKPIVHCKTLQNLPKPRFLGLKICHLATLEECHDHQNDDATMTSFFPDLPVSSNPDILMAMASVLEFLLA
jgi:hypothetical protein